MNERRECGHRNLRRVPLGQLGPTYDRTNGRARAPRSVREGLQSLASYHTARRARRSPLNHAAGVVLQPITDARRASPGGI
jgi:hypothetical protein